MNKSKVNLIKTLIISLLIVSCTINKDVMLGNYKSESFSVIPILGIKHGSYYLYDVPDFVDLKNTYPVDSFRLDTLRIANYRFNKLHGLDTEFGDNGRINYQWQYNKGKLKGYSLGYFDDGSLHFKVEYKNDKIWNIVEQYDIDGNLLDNGSLLNGEGIMIKYFPNGRIREKGLIKNGYRQDDWEYYTNTGHKRVITFNKGIDNLTKSKVIIF